MFWGTGGFKNGKKSHNVFLLIYMLFSRYSTIYKRWVQVPLLIFDRSSELYIIPDVPVLVDDDKNVQVISNRKISQIYAFKRVIKQMSQQADKETENYLKNGNRNSNGWRKRSYNVGIQFCGLLKSLSPAKSFLYRQGTSNQASYVKGSCNWDRCAWIHGQSCSQREIFGNRLRCIWIKKIFHYTNSYE